jgi:ribosomal protein S18 acetylase RimI-like enzyme
MNPWPTPEPARNDELADAFRLLLQRHTPAEADRLLANALYLVFAGQLDVDGVFVLHDGPAVAASVLNLPSPGATANLWPPQARPGTPPGADDTLLDHSLTWLRYRRVKLVQAQLLSEEGDDARTLERHGFRPITHLWHFRHDLRSLPAPRPERLRYQPYDDTLAGLFGATLLRSYEGTLDCPEVNGVRTAEEVLLGHRAQGRFDPEHWWLLRRSDEPIGVVLLADHPEVDEREVAYVGLVPAARRHGFGREAMRRVLVEARVAERRLVTLSVDVRNRPAWELYRSLGFEPIERRVVFLRLLA